MNFATHLLRWYAAHQRDLPWRKTKDPYRILVSEFMLQQTQVQTVIPYYLRWLKRFPSFRTLAQSRVNSVLKAWEGLGYYSRARHLQALAKIVVHRHQGQLPRTLNDLRALPGIGRYTAGAILSIAFNQRSAVMDGNVQRVLARFFAVKQNVRSPQTQKKLWRYAETLVPSRHPGDFNQALMDLGSMVCLPKNPDCGVCPLRSTCKALAQHLQHVLPRKTKKAKTPHYHIGAGVIWKGNRILISQRPLNGLLGGLWEFPGGKQIWNETIPQTIRREIQEELGIRVHVGRKVAEVDHAYSHFKITLHAHHCRYISGIPRALGVEDFRWVIPKALKRFAFPAANHPILERLAQKLPAVPATT